MPNCYAKPFDHLGVLIQSCMVQEQTMIDTGSKLCNADDKVHVQITKRHVQSSNTLDVVLLLSDGSNNLGRRS